MATWSTKLSNLTVLVDQVGGKHLNVKDNYMLDEIDHFGDVRRGDQPMQNRKGINL